MRYIAMGGFERDGGCPPNAVVKFALHSVLMFEGAFGKPASGWISFRAAATEVCTFRRALGGLTSASVMLGTLCSLFGCTTEPPASTGKTGGHAGREDAGLTSDEPDAALEATSSAPTPSVDASSICSCGSCDQDLEELASQVCEASFASVERASGCEGYVIYRYMNADRTFSLFVGDDGALLAHVSRACQAGTELPSSCATDVCTVCVGPGTEEARASRLPPNCR